MKDSFLRTELLFGKDAMEKLENAHVAVFGIGGVGGHVAEALARSGIYNIDLFDDDIVSVTNINRQIVATSKTIGRYKVDVMKERILDINPDAIVTVYKVFYMPDTADKYDFSKYTYIIDAVDTVIAKIEIVLHANCVGVPVISSMGAGNKLDPTKLEVSDIYKTSVCPLARIMRKELRARGIEKLKVVYSKEEALKPCESNEVAVKGRVLGSNAFVPATAGLIIAGEVIKDIANVVHD